MNDSRKYGIPSEPAEREVGFLLVSSFSMLPFIAAIEPLRVANRLSGRSLYSWRLFTVDGEPAVANNGMAQAVDSAIECARHSQFCRACLTKLWKWCTPCSLASVRAGSTIKRPG